MIKLLVGAPKSFTKLINNSERTSLLMSTIKLCHSCSNKFQRLSANNLSKSSTRRKKKIEATSPPRISWTISPQRNSSIRTSELDQCQTWPELTMMAKLTILTIRARMILMGQEVTRTTNSNKWRSSKWMNKDATSSSKRRCTWRRKHWKRRNWPRRESDL